jgi:hypothetical protein
MKFLAIIFSIIVMTLAVVPCCIYDNCSDEQAQETKSGKPEAPCSPFVACSCSPLSICIPIAFTCIPMMVVVKNKTHYHQSFASIYSPSIWQPPKIAC